MRRVSMLVCSAAIACVLSGAAEAQELKLLAGWAEILLWEVSIRQFQNHQNLFWTTDLLQAWGRKRQCCGWIFEPRQNQCRSSLQISANWFTGWYRSDREGAESNCRPL